MTGSIEQEITKLRKDLERHNRLYYVETAPEIPDREFDQLLKRLQQLEADHPEFNSEDSPTRKVGGAPIDGFRTVDHRVPMLSIENMFEEQEVIDWDSGLQATLENASPDYTVEYKIDGVAMALVYENGRLVRGVTRGNGTTGDDITSNARIVGGVPLRLQTDKPPPVLEVRGEVIIHGEDFTAFQAAQVERGEEPFRNPRNAAAGALKLLDPSVSRQRKLRFLAHGVGYCKGISWPTYIRFLDSIRSFGIPVTPGVQRAEGINALQAAIGQLVQGVPELPFEVDGIVIKINPLNQREELGATSKFPRWVKAYKWERYEAETRVTNISIQVGKTGVLTPVAELEPVEIDGTIVSRASLHNRDELESGRDDWRSRPRRKGRQDHPTRVASERGRTYRQGASVHLSGSLSGMSNENAAGRGRRLHPLLESSVSGSAAGNADLLCISCGDGHRWAGRKTGGSTDGRGTH